MLRASCSVAVFRPVDVIAVGVREVDQRAHGFEMRFLHSDTQANRVRFLNPWITLNHGERRWIAHLNGHRREVVPHVARLPAPPEFSAISCSRDATYLVNSTPASASQHSRVIPSPIRAANYLTWGLKTRREFFNMLRSGGV